MWSTEAERHHFIRCSRGAYGLKLAGEYAIVLGLFAEIGLVGFAALQVMRDRPLQPVVFAAGGVLVAILAGATAVAGAWRWARAAGFSWDYDKNLPVGPGASAPPP